MECAFERAVRGILHHPARKEPDHNAGDDLTVVSREEQPSVSRQSEHLLKLILRDNRQSFTSSPVDVNGIIGRYVVATLRGIDRNSVFYGFLYVCTFVCREPSEEGIRAPRQV